MDGHNGILPFVQYSATSDQDLRHPEHHVIFDCKMSNIPNNRHAVILSQIHLESYNASKYHVIKHRWCKITGVFVI